MEHLINHSNQMLLNTIAVAPAGDHAQSRIILIHFYVQTELSEGNILGLPSRVMYKETENEWCASEEKLTAASRYCRVLA